MQEQLPGEIQTKRAPPSEPTPPRSRLRLSEARSFEETPTTLAEATNAFPLALRRVFQALEVQERNSDLNSQAPRSQGVHAFPRKTEKQRRE